MDENEWQKANREANYAKGFHVYLTGKIKMISRSDAVTRREEARKFFGQDSGACGY